MYIATQEIYSDLITSPVTCTIKKVTAECYFNDYGERILKSELETGRYRKDSFVVFATGATPTEAEDDAFQKVTDHLTKMIEDYRRLHQK